MKRWKMLRTGLVTTALSVALLSASGVPAAADAAGEDAWEIVEVLPGGDATAEEYSEEYIEQAEEICDFETEALQGETAFFEDYPAEEGYEEGLFDEPSDTETEPSAGEDTGDEGKAGENASWKLDGSTLTISGTGAMYDFQNPSETPWHDVLGSVTKVVVEEGITAVGSFSFSSAASLQEVDLPNGSLAKIGGSAFASCSKLTEIVIPDKVTEIGEAAISGAQPVTIKGSFGTAAERYAKQNGLPFVPLQVTDISGAKVTLSHDAYDYNGNPLTPAVTVVISETTLKENTDYTLSFKNNTNAGTAVVQVSGKGNYSGEVSKNYTIRAASMASASVSGISNKPYTGSQITQSPVVKVGVRTLAVNKDYKLSYSANVNVGTATVTISGTGNYSGSVSRQFKITKAAMSTASVSNIKKKIYNGKKQTQKPVVVIAGRTLKQGTDYKVTYKNNKKIGTATMFLTGKGNYTGKIKRTFKIQKASLADAKVTGVQDKTYTGSQITQSLKVKLGGKTLKSGSEYTTRYVNNVNVGTASVILKGKGNYKGKQTVEFEIKKADIRDASIQNVTDKPYTGKPQKQNPVITLSGRTLKAGTDYVLSYTNNVQLGTATMTVSGKGNYTGERKVNFAIRILSLADAQVSGIVDKEYTGNAVTQSITVTLKGTTLRNGRDYTVSYGNNVAIGRATITISGRGSYTGTLTGSFAILPPSTVVTSATVVGTRMTVSWASRENIVDGFQIQYSTDSSFNKVAKTFQIRGSKATQYSFPVPAGSRYYARVRTYKIIGGSNVYSKWSAAR